MASLLDSYLAGAPELRAAYAAGPESVASHPIPARGWDTTLAEEMRAYQAHIGGTARFGGDEGVIITGQQPGIFTGPLYTIYKAITAIRLSESLQRETGTPFAPVYWVGGDDHDYDEIRRAHLLSKTHTAVPLALEPSAGEGARSIFQIPADPALHALVDEAARLAPGSEFTEDVRAFLHESLEASANLSEWHARLMARLFRDTPLVFFTPELPAARAAARAVFRREIEAPLESTARVNEGGALLDAAGYGAQVVKAEDACNFFLEHAGQRCRVRYVDGRFVLPDTGDAFSPDALLTLLETAPERFTANVALRCIVQQHLFPARAYVAGPGELAYWGQLKGLFAHFDLPMPVVYPRSRAVLTTVKTNKLLGKYGFRPDDFLESPDGLEERALRASGTDPALDVLGRHRAALEAELDAMARDFDALGRAGKAAGDLAATFGGQVRRGLDHLERTLLRTDENRTTAVRAQLERLSAELAPERKPQERYYTIFSWVFQHGWDLIPRLIRELDPAKHGVQEVEL